MSQQQFGVALHLLFYVVATVLVIFTTLRWSVHHQDVTADAANLTCVFADDELTLVDNNDGNECTRDIQIRAGNLEGQYFRWPAPRTQSCTNSCYMGDYPTTCDPLTQQCLGDWRDCAGKCNDTISCDYSIIVPDFRLLSGSSPNVADSYVHTCVAGRCYMHFRVAAYVTVPRPLSDDNGQTAGEPRPPTRRATCEEYLDADFYATYRDCLHINRVLIDTALTAPATNWGDATRPAQYLQCVVSIGCGSPWIDPDALAAL